MKLIWSGRSDDTFCLFSSTLYRVHQHNPNNTFSVQLFNSVAPTVEEAALASSLVRLVIASVVSCVVMHEQFVFTRASLSYFPVAMTTDSSLHWVDYSAYVSLNV